MLDNCRKFGIEPLSLEQFVREDQRMLMDLVRRKNGLWEHPPTYQY